VDQALGLVRRVRIQGIPNALLELAHRGLGGQVREVQASRDSDVGRYDLQGEDRGRAVPFRYGVGHDGRVGRVDSLGRQVMAWRDNLL
jgi:hypothetical protein